MDVHIRRAVTSALRLRSIDVLTAQEDGAAEFNDDRLLERATELGRVLVESYAIPGNGNPCRAISVLRL
jgi:hypothetical protein